jgi:hypothetical protein
MSTNRATVDPEVFDQARLVGDISGRSFTYKRLHQLNKRRLDFVSVVHSSPHSIHGFVPPDVPLRKHHASNALEATLHSH